MKDLPKQLRTRWSESERETPEWAKRPHRPKVRAWHSADTETAAKRQQERNDAPEAEQARRRSRRSALNG